MARNIDVFGFDELEKAMKQCEKNYPSQADAFLMAEGRAVNKRTKSLTPVRTKKLRNSWRTKKVKLYKGGKVRVVRVQSTAPHAHLIELGHKIVSGGRTRERGRKLNRVLQEALNPADMYKVILCLKNQCRRHRQNSTRVQKNCLIR